ncbi:hypothetical protein ACW6QP_15345 [Salegentibacter sp. HM20]
MKNLLKFILFWVIIPSGIAQNDFPLEVKDILKEGNQTFYDLQVLRTKGQEIKKEYEDPITSELKLSDYAFEQIRNEQITFTLDTLNKEEIQILIKDSSASIKFNYDQMPYDIKINLESKYVELNNRKLIFHKKIKVPNSDNIFKSSWNGFLWKGEGENFHVTIGKLDAKGKMFIKVDGIDFKGKKTRILLLS